MIIINGSMGLMGMVLIAVLIEAMPERAQDHSFHANEAARAQA
jgi:hypothetical protein